MKTTNTFPSWYEKYRRKAEAEYEKLSWPTRKDENWRFGSYKEGDLSGARLVHGGQPVNLPEPAFKDSLCFIFFNNTLVKKPSNLPEGVIAGPVNEIFETQASCIENILPPLQGRLGSPKLAAFHRAKSEGGMAINLSGIQEKIIEIIHVVSGDSTTVLPQLFLLALPGAKGRIVERFVNANATEALTVVSVSDVIALDGSELRYLVSQELNLQSRFIRLADSRLEKGAQIKAASLQTGARWAREETYSTVDGEEGMSEILSVAIPGTDQEFDQRTFQHHGAPHTGSDLLFKNTLFGTGKTIFSGLIFVDEGAHYTDAYQTCRNLFMSDQAEANSMPGLEINADQVKCSHGSTSARVSDEEIYYLCSRGITPGNARRMVAQGFSAEVVEKLEDPDLQDFALNRIEAKFAQVS